MGNIKEILFISNLCSPRILDCISKNSLIFIGQAGPKFYRLLADGLALNADKCTIETLSAIPVSSKSHPKRFWNIPTEMVGDIKYNYVPTINLPALRNIIVFFYSFFYVSFWCLKSIRKNKIIICDILGLSVSLASVLACKLTRTKIVMIVTDLPGFIISDSQNRNRLKGNIFIKTIPRILSISSGYIFLTNQMNEVVNPNGKPYLVMEGLVDYKMTLSINKLENKASKKILLYAGGIFEEYGVKKLIEAFMQLKGANLQLSIYGKGAMEKDMQFYMGIDSRIIYHGIVPNELVIQKEIEATLLINPRPSKEEFTKYSFPSKNMEYMSSGTPLVTCPLPGMPSEYHQYVYLFDDETVDGVYITLKKLLEKSDKELYDFGYTAKQFVLEKKSNIKQAERILNFAETL